MRRRAARPEQPDFPLRAQHPWAPDDQASQGLFLTAEEKLELLRVGEVVEFKASGPPILMQGGRAAHLFYLSKGVVQGTHTIRSGVRQSVALYWPGDFFGTARQGQFFSTAEAVTNCTVVKFPITGLEMYLQKHPATQQKLLIKAAHDLRIAQRGLIVMGALDVTRRLAVFLLDCCGQPEYFDFGTQTLTVPITRNGMVIPPQTNRV